MSSTSRLHRFHANKCSGSTATIIRLPYTTTLKPYKGDFLYRTTDFAIWTTVEVGVGITAGCIATLKPLLKASFLTTRSGQRSTGNLYGSGNKLGSRYGRNTAMGLQDMRPVIGKPTTTTTTVTAGRDSSSSDEEKMIDHVGRPTGGWDLGISKSVTTTITEERTAGPQPSRNVRREHPSTPTIERRRNGSPGGDSASTLNDEDRGRPLRPYGAF